MPYHFEIYAMCLFWLHLNVTFSELTVKNTQVSNISFKIVVNNLTNECLILKNGISYHSLSIIRHGD
jgi:hypothetical protein